MKNARQLICGIGLLITIILGLAGCKTSPPASFNSSFDYNDPVFASDPLSGGGGSTNRGGVAFKPEDTIRITFVGPENSQVIQPHEGRVSEDGTITLPLIGAVKVAGKTAGELRTIIHDAYVPRYYLRLTVTVQGQDRFYYVGGEVKAPNRYIWAGEISLTKAIQTASDFTDWAQKKKVKITRADGTTVGPVNCVKILEGRLPDPPVYPGDKIYVPRKVW